MERGHKYNIFYFDVETPAALCAKLPKKSNRKKEVKDDEHKQETKVESKRGRRRKTLL